jgi:acyl-CoA synthetase (AMP-forming)/AMP-acid ligase II
MSLLIEIDQIRSYLAQPGQPFELVEEIVDSVPLRVYRNLPPNIGHLIAEAGRFGDRPFLITGEKRLSYTETLGQASALAAWFRDRHGIGRGTRVAIAMRNCAEWIIAFLAIQFTGSTAVLVNSRGTADDMQYAVAETNCALLIVDRRRADSLAASFHGPIVLADPGSEFREADGTLIPLEPAPVVLSDAGHADPAIIMFTSGTTGRPKGAMLNHRGVGMFVYGMRHNGAVYLTHAARRMGVEPTALAAKMPQQGQLAIYPLFHVSGASAMLFGALNGGGKLVFVDRWNPAEALRLIQQERLTQLGGPPSVFWDILACPDFAGADVSSITNIGIGGQATPPNLLAEISKHFPNAAPGGGYGQTETNGSISAGTGGEYLSNPKGSGRILPGTEVMVADEHGNPLPVGEAGEICVRSPLNMMGYWNQPEANAAVFRDGWLRTGDVGYVDENRFIVIVDRKKDMVVRGGENIYCAELERVYQEYPGVLEVAAFGVPDDRWGERVVLAAVPLEGATLSADDMLAFGRGRLADYKIPSEIVFFRDPLERNTIGKVDKAALRNAYANR